ncbi:hypothetical protein BgiBS90_015800 [Biomphalaria glabrata]|nr:hypothetical protein BgiBS90_015800 [Biomphalaria glabrata]
MPRIYKRKLGSRKYKDYEEETLLKAIEDCKKPEMSIAEVVKIYKIPQRTLRNKVGGQHSKSHGGQCALGFLSRHEDLITQGTCQNIKRQRAALSHGDINVYFEHLRKSLDGVSAENILNYDKTNLTDNPGQKKCIFRRGIKHPERDKFF